MFPRGGAVFVGHPAGWAFTRQERLEHIHRRNRYKRGYLGKARLGAYTQWSFRMVEQEVQGALFQETQG